MADLTTRIGPLKLKNPIITGAGPLAGTADHIKKCVDAGFGAVCTKTTTYSHYLQRYPRPLYRLKDYTKRPDDPRYVPADYMWLHREHNSVFPPDKFVSILKEVSGYCHDNEVALIGTFAGRGLSEWVDTCSAYVEAGCDALELNFCCPFPPQELEQDPSNAFMGILFTQNPDRGAEVIHKLKQTVAVPLFPKISPAGGNFVEIAKCFEEAGADGLSLFANERLLRIDIEKAEPVNYGPCAGTAPHFKAHTLRWVSEIAKNTGLPIVGGRGATNWKDIIEFLMAGSSAVEMCTPIMLRGMKYVDDVLQGLESFMERKRYKTINEIRGRALKGILSTRQLIDDTKALYSEIDMVNCIGCHRCVEVCVYDAIQALPKKARILSEKCVGCTLCSQVCPVSVISVGERDSDLDHFRALAWEHKELMPELFKD
jgi:dihydroorotate dehydrogenase/NAD-dependent dihydropyrimidine dehydrogenase PreA subunit